MSTDEYEAIPEAEWKTLATTEITHLTDEEKDYLPLIQHRIDRQAGTLTA